MEELIWRDKRISKLKECPGDYGIYVIRKGTEIIRIGETSSGYKRIRSGFNQKLRISRNNKEFKNYYAYHWRDFHKELFIDFHSISSKIFSENVIRRALEAEITLQLRLNYKKWPVNMTEIHFYEKFRTKSAIIKECKKVLGFYSLEYFSHI